MSALISVTHKVSQDWADAVAFLAKETDMSKSQIWIEGIKALLAMRLDCQVLRLNDDTFDALLDTLERPAPDTVQEKLDKTLSTPYVWEQ